MEADKPGYKRPPRATQFRAGHSGNPKGRPKGTRNLKCELIDELAESINIKEQGRSKNITKQRALIKAMAAKAIQGDTRAASVLMNIMFRLLRPDLSEEAPSHISKEDRAILDAFVVRRRTPRQRTEATGPDEKADLKYKS